MYQVDETLNSTEILGRGGESPRLKVLSIKGLKVAIVPYTNLPFCE